jgi:hypothetical protein
MRARGRTPTFPTATTPRRTGQPPCNAGHVPATDPYTNCAARVLPKDAARPYRRGHTTFFDGTRRPPRNRHQHWRANREYNDLIVRWLQEASEIHFKNICSSAHIWRLRQANRDHVFKSLYSLTFGSVYGVEMAAQRLGVQRGAGLPPHQKLSLIRPLRCNAVLGRSAVCQLRSPLTAGFRSYQSYKP